MTKTFIDSYVLDFYKDDPEAYLKYQQLIQHMFKFEAECKLPFEASSRTYMLNDLVFARSLTNTYRATLTRDAEVLRALAWDYVLVALYLENPVQIKTDDVEFQLEPNQLLFLDLSKPVTIQAQNINVLSLNIPTALLSPLVGIKDNMHCVILNEQPHAQLLANYMKTLEQVVGDTQTKDVALMIDSILRMVANCLMTLSSGDNQNDKLAGATNVNISLFEIKHAIDAQIEDANLSLETILQQFPVSRATIYRLFEPLGGVASYIQNRKLDFAYRELSIYRDKTHNISKLAYRLGFSHPSAFARAFKAKFGINPSEVKFRPATQTKQDLPWHFDFDLEPYKR